MKIDIAEVPKIRDLLDKLIVDQHNHSNITSSGVEQFRVVSEGGTHAGELSRDELLTVFQTRIDAGMKHLAQRYQIDFTKANVNAGVLGSSSAPTAPVAADTALDA